MKFYCFSLNSRLLKYEQFCVISLSPPLIVIVTLIVILILIIIIVVIVIAITILIELQPGL